MATEAAIPEPVPVTASENYEIHGANKETGEHKPERNFNRPEISSSATGEENIEGTPKEDEADVAEVKKLESDFTKQKYEATSHTKETDTRDMENDNPNMAYEIQGNRRPSEGPLTEDTIETVALSSSAPQVPQNETNDEHSGKAEGEDTSIKGIEAADKMQSQSYDISSEETCQVNAKPCESDSAGANIIAILAESSKLVEHKSSQISEITEANEAGDKIMSGTLDGTSNILPDEKDEREISKGETIFKEMYVPAACEVIEATDKASDNVEVFIVKQGSPIDADTENELKQKEDETADAGVEISSMDKQKDNADDEKPDVEEHLFVATEPISETNATASNSEPYECIETIEAAECKEIGESQTLKAEKELKTEAGREKFEDENPAHNASMRTEADTVTDAKSTLLAQNSKSKGSLEEDVDIDKAVFDADAAGYNQKLEEPETQSDITITGEKIESAVAYEQPGSDPSSMPEEKNEMFSQTSKAITEEESDNTMNKNFTNTEEKTMLFHDRSTEHLIIGQDSHEGKTMMNEEEEFTFEVKEKDCMTEPQLISETDHKPKVEGPGLVAGENLEATGISEHIETEQVHVEEVPHQVQEISSTDGAPKEVAEVEMQNMNKDGIEELDISNAASDFKEQDIDIYESTKGSKLNETDIEYREKERDENPKIISENRYKAVEEVSEEAPLAENIAQILQEPSSTKLKKEQDPVITYEKIEDEIRRKDGNPVTDNLDGTNATRTIEETCSLEGELRGPEISASEHETLVNEQDGLDEARQEVSRALPQTTAQDPQESLEEKLDEKNDIMDKDISSEQNIEKKTDIKEVVEETPIDFLDAAHAEEISAGIEQPERSKNINEQTDREKECMAEPQLILATDQKPKVVEPDLVAGENLKATGISEHIETEQVQVEEVPHQVQEISSSDGAPKETVVVEMQDRHQDGIEELDISNAASDFKEQDIDIYESGKCTKQNETDIEYREGERDENLEIISENKHKVVEEVSEEAPLAENIAHILQEPSSTKQSKEQDPVITFEKNEDEVREKDGNPVTDNLDGKNATRTIEETCSLEGELRDPEISASEQETLVNEQDGLDEARQEASTALPETTEQDPQESPEEKRDEDNEIKDKDISSEHIIEKKTDIKEVVEETPLNFLDAAHVKEISAGIQQPEESKNIDEQTDREKDCTAEPQLVLATAEKPKVVGPDLVAGENLETTGISEHIETEQVHVQEVPHQVQQISSTDGAPKETVVVEMQDRHQDGTEELDISNAASDFKEQDIDIYESRKCSKQNETDIKYREGERDENLEIKFENIHKVVEEVSEEAPLADKVAQILQDPSSTKLGKEQDPVITFEKIEDEVREKDGNPVTDNLDGKNATRTIEETCSLEGELRDPEISASEQETLVNEQDGLDEARQEASTALPETTEQDPQESPEEKRDEDNEIKDKDISSEHNIEKKTDIKEVVEETPLNFLDSAHIEEISAGIEQPEGSKNINEQTDREKECMAEPQLILATDQKHKVVEPDLVAGENLETTGISEHIETEQVHVEEVPHQVQEISSSDGAPKETVVVEMQDRHQDGIEELDISKEASDFKEQDIDIYESGKCSKKNETDIEYREGERVEDLEIISENKQKVVEEVSEEAPLAENIAQILQEPSSTKQSKEQDPVITFEKIEDAVREKDGNPVTDNLDGTNATRTIEETSSLEGEQRDPEISASEHETLVNEQGGLNEARQEASTALPETTEQDPRESPDEKWDEENEIMDKDILNEHNIEKKTDIKEVVEETPLNFLDAAHVEEISAGIQQPEGSKNIDEQTEREKDCTAEPQLVLATAEKPKVVGPDLVAGENLEATAISEDIETEQVHVEEAPHQVQEISSNDVAPKETVVEGIQDKHQDGSEEIDISNAASDFKEQDIDIYESGKCSKQNETDIEYREGERDENLEIISENKHQVVEQFSEEAPLTENIAQILQEPSSTKFSKEHDPVITFEKIEDEVREKDGNPVTDNLDDTNATRAIEETCSLEGELRDAEISASEHETLVNEQDSLDEARQEASTVLPETTAQDPQESPEEKRDEEKEIMDKDISSEHNIEKKTDIKEVVEETPLNFLDAAHVEEISAGIQQPEGSKNIDEQTDREKDCTAEPQLVLATAQKPKVVGPDLVAGENLEATSISEDIETEQVHVEEVPHQVQQISSTDGAPKETVVVEIQDRHLDGNEELDISNAASDFKEQDINIYESGKCSKQNETDIEYREGERDESLEIISEDIHKIVEDVSEEGPLAKNIAQILQEPSSTKQSKEQDPVITFEKIEDEVREKDGNPVTDNLEGKNATRTIEETCYLEGELRDPEISALEHEALLNEQDGLDEARQEASTALPETTEQDPQESPEEKQDEENEIMDKDISSEHNIEKKTDIKEIVEETPLNLLDAANVEEISAGIQQPEGCKNIDEQTDREKDCTAEPQLVSATAEKPKVVGPDLVAGENLKSTGISEDIETEQVHVEEVPHQVKQISSTDGAPKETVVVEIQDRHQDGTEELDISNAIDNYESGKCSKQNETDIEYREGERDENLEIIYEDIHKVVEEVSEEAPLAENIAQILQEPSSTKQSKEQEPIITFEKIEDEVREKDGNPVTENLDGKNATRTIEETCSLGGELRDPEISASEQETLVNKHDGRDEARQEASTALPETTEQDLQESPEEKQDEENDIIDKDILSEHNIEKKTDINEVVEETPLNFLDAAHVEEISAGLQQPEGSKNIDEQTDREKDCTAEPQLVLATAEKPKVVGPDLVAGENLEATGISEHIETEQVHVEEAPHQVQEISSTDVAPKETVVVEMQDRHQDGTEELDISNAALDFKEQDIDIYESGKCSKQNETDIEYREGEREENHDIISENIQQVVKQVSEEAPLAENIAQILQEPSSTKLSKEYDPVITFEKIEDEVREKDGNPVTDNLDDTNAIRAIEETCSLEGELRDPEISASEHETLVNELDSLDEARQKASTALPETKAQDHQESPEEKRDEENEIMDKDISSEHNIEKKTDIKEVVEETPLNFLDTAHAKEISAGIQQPEGSKNIDEQTDREKDCMAEPQLVLATAQKPKLVGPDLVAGENLEATGISEHIETEQVHVQEVPHQVQQISSMDGAPKETVVVEMPDMNQDGTEELDISNTASDFKEQDIDIYESGKCSKQNEGERDENLEIISENRHQVVKEVFEEAPLAENIAQILQEPSSTKLSKEHDPLITFEKIEDEIRRKEGNPVTDNLDDTNATRAIEETCSLEEELRDSEISASEHETLVNEQDGLDEARQEASTALPETTAHDPQESPEEKLDEENEIMDKDISSEQNIDKKTDIKEVVMETPVDFLDATHVEEISVEIVQPEESKKINEQTDMVKDCMAEPLSISATEEKPKELGSELMAEENLETTSISKHTDTVQVQAEEVPHQVQEISFNARTPHEEIIEGTMPPINITSSTFEPTEGSIEEEDVIYRAKIGSAQATMMTLDTSKEVEEDIYSAKIETAVATMMNLETALKEVQLDECASEFTKVPEATNTTLQHEAVNIFKLGDSSSIIQPMATEDAGADKDSVMVEMPNRNRENIEELETSNEVSDFNEQDNNICERAKNSTLNETDIENQVEERTEASEIISESKNHVVEELTKEAPLAENLTQIQQEPSSAMLCEEPERITTATTEKIEDESKQKDESPVTEDLEGTNATRTTEETRSLEGEARELGVSPSEHEIFENKQDTLDEEPHEASTGLPETSTPEHLKEKLDEENETMDNSTSSEQNEDQKTDIMEVAKETPIEFLDAAHIKEDVGRTSESEKIKGGGGATDGPNQDITADGRTNVSCRQEEVHTTGRKTNTEVMALTEENFHPHEEGELKSASDLISENEISGTFPKPYKTETMDNANNLKNNIQECTVEQISGKDSKHGQMNLNEAATGDQVNSTQDQLETIRNVILAEEIEHVPEESQTEKGSEDIKDQIIEATTEFQKTKSSYVTPNEVTDTDPTHIEKLGVKYQNVDSELEDPHAAEDPNEESRVSLIIRSMERELKEGTENLLNISSPEQQVSHNIREENIENTYIYHSQESVPLLAEASIEKVQVDEKPGGQHEEEVERVNLKETDSIVLPVVTTVLAVAEEERMKAKKLDTEESQAGEIESSVPATKDIEQVRKSIAANRTGKEEVSVPKPIPEPLNTVEPVIEGNKFPHESLPYGTIKDQHEESSTTKLLEEQNCENTTTNETIEDQSTRNDKTLVKESSESSIARGTDEDVSLKNETFKEVESSKLELEIIDHPDGATKEEKLSALEKTTAIVKENNEYIETHEELMPAYESVTDDQTKETQDSQEVTNDILMAEEDSQGITPTAQSVVVVPDAEERANVKLYVNEEGTHMKELTPVPVENVGEIIKSDLGPIENLEVRESIEATEAEKSQAKEDLIGDSGVSEEDKRQHIDNTIITGADEPIKTVKEQSIDANKESETLQASDAYKTRDGKLDPRDSIEDTGAEKLEAKEDLNWDSRASTVTEVSEEDAKQRVESTITTTELEESEQIIRDESVENCDANKECAVLHEPDETSKAFGIESKPIEQETPINVIITKELPEETEWADLTKNILEAMMAGDTPLKEFSTNEILPQPTEETKNILEETTNTDTEQQSYGSIGTSREYITPTEELSGREGLAKDIQVETMAKGTPLEESVTYSIGDGMATKILQEETKVGNNFEETAIRLDPEGKSDEIDCVNTNSEDINLIKEVSENVERASPTEDMQGNTMIEAIGELSQLPVPDGIANEILPQEPNEIKNVEATIKLDLKENSEEEIFSDISKEATTCIEELPKEVEVREETMVEHTPIQELSHHQIANETANEISSHEREEIKNDKKALTVLDLKETSDETNCTNMNEATTLVEKLPRDIEKTAPVEDIQEENMDNLVEELPQHAIVGEIASDVLPQQMKEINNIEEVPIKDRDTTTQAITLVEEHLEEAGKDGPIEDIREETATNTPLDKPSQFSMGDGIATQILPHEKEEVNNVSEEPSKLDLEEKRYKANFGDDSTEASTLIEELSEDVMAGMAKDIREEAKFEGTHVEEPCQNPHDTREGENVGKGIQNLKDSLFVADKQNQHETGSNENAKAKLSASSIHVTPEQTEPVGKSFNTEEEDSRAVDAIGSEPQCQAKDFKEEKDTSKRNEDKQDSAKSSLAFLIRGSTTGISEELEKLLEEKEQKEKQEDQQPDKARVRTNEEEKNSEKKEEEQDQEEGNDNQKEDSGYDAPVMVEASKDMDAKVHKKPHNILSGVGTKVKHSISKVKKAITGKSSHPKPSSP